MYTYLFPLYVTLGFYIKSQGAYVKRHPFICFVADARSGKILSLAFSLGKPTVDLYARALLSLRAVNSSKAGSPFTSCDLLRARGASFISQVQDISCDVDSPSVLPTYRGCRRLTFITQSSFASLVMHHLYDWSEDFVSALDSTMSIPHSSLSYLLKQAVGKTNNLIDEYPHWISLDKQNLLGVGC
ncbi:hypothetical protein D3C77_176220 [compost metagenome]